MTALHDLIAGFAAIGATDDGGVCRLAATALDKRARDLFLREIGNRSLVPRIDAIGNMFGVAILDPAFDDVVITGSHLDSQPTGGRYDGAYGVLAGLLAVEAVRERCLANPGAARRNLAVANWTNEEGARFQPSLTGSSVFAGSLSLQDAYACADGDGVTLGAALAAIGYCGVTPLEYRPVRYVELHVEQGDRLEQVSGDIAAVSGAWMTRKISVVFEGDYSHTGPTPMPMRRDALRAAARAIEALYVEVAREDVGAHASAARINAYPNSPNVVAGRVRVWFEIRHEDEAAVVAISDRFLKRIEREAREIGVGISIAADDRRSAPLLDPDGVELILTVASDVGCKALTFKTITGHDALAIQKRIPASLIFVPSRGGLSHNPREFTAPEALDKGYAVLVETLWRMVTAA
ncbi:MULTISPECIES: allantoate amidohydrolase [Bradyrhizobium]|uniref:Allantoate amidohydrolase n=1 Tax=Bradyrhizobium diversitatis TaxID=2755406 RepID=A0ABS0NV48_9BRAD|nr:MULTISPECIES: allantoate amidohydrolase [Bradyrhizobium]KYK43086.1 Zn-dependent hydrolase [Bradyrhizobium liaoningense]MBH5384876.1 allantoate amidohydrolase [Bradyrhizobium diversitatis]UPJ64583.1 allantoate amidohydrolase [Bradyrhizobium sp. 191]